MINTAILQTVVQGGPGPGPADLNSYPAALCEAPLSTVLDDLGYFNRECGSYAAWMVQQAGQQISPHSVLGDPGYWPGTVDPSWIVTGPEPGDIGIVPVDLPWMTGHGMYIDWVQPSGDLVAKSYNLDEAGCFSLDVWAPSGVKSGTYEGGPYSLPFSLVFIRFPAI